MAKPTLQFKADPQDIANLNRQMDRLNKEFGITAKKSVEWAAWYVAKSAKATT